MKSEKFAGYLEQAQTLFAQFEKVAVPIIAQLIAWLSSPLALVIYSWVAILLCMGFSALYAREQIKLLKSFSEADLIRKRPGPPARKPESIQRDIDALLVFAKSRMRKISLMTMSLFMAGILVPGTVLGIIALYQYFLMPGPPVLMVDGTPGQSLPMPSQVLYFVADQSLKGGLGDTFEVFKLGVTPITNNPDNHIYSAFVLIFRFIAGGTVAAILYTNYRVMRGMRQVDDAVAKLRDQLGMTKVASELAIIGA